MGRPERLRIRRGRSGTEVDLCLDSVARVKKHPVRGPKSLYMCWCLCRRTGQDAIRPIQLAVILLQNPT